MHPRTARRSSATAERPTLSGRFAEELAALRSGLSEIARTDPRRLSDERIAELAKLLHAHGDALGVGTLGRDEIRAAVLSDRREVWLWLVGERRTEQFVSSTLGRLTRRS